MNMNKYAVKTLLTAAGVFAVLPLVWAAPSDPGTPVRGQVTAVDTTAKTVTLQNPRTQTTTVLHVTDATKYLTDVTGALSDVKVGQTVRVIGETTDNTISARMVQIVPPEEASAPMGGRPGGQGGGRRGGVQGVVATVTPTLTITTADKQTDTVTTDATTRIMTSHAGTLADVKAQENVNAMTTGTGDGVTATLIHVRAAGAYGRGGQGGRPGGGAAGQ